MPLPELVFENKFSDLALILRSTDAVSALCCAALTEDRYVHQLRRILASDWLDHNRTPNGGEPLVQ